MIKDSDMPELQPIPIVTKKRSYWIRLFIWILSTRKFRVVKDWYCKLPNGQIVKIPAGFEFDGASIPRPFWWILSPVGLLLIPGLIHDYAYKFNKLISIVEEKDSDGNTQEKKVIIEGKSKAYWDTLYRDVAVDINGFMILIWIAWLLLLAFGWFAWWSHRKKDNPEALSN